MANNGYDIIFPTKTFFVKRLNQVSLEEAIALKDNKPRFIMWFKGQRKGRIYYGLTKQLDFIIKKHIDK